MRSKLHGYHADVSASAIVVAARPRSITARDVPPGCEICSTVRSALSVVAGFADESAWATMPTSEPRSSTIGMRRTCLACPSRSMTSSTSSLCGAGRELVGAHHVAHAAAAILALGDAADGDVAIGDDADEALASDRSSTTGTMPTFFALHDCAASRTVASGVTQPGPWS